MFVVLPQIIYKIFYYLAKAKLKDLFVGQLCTSSLRKIHVAMAYKIFPEFDYSGGDIEKCTLYALLLHLVVTPCWCNA